MNTSKYHFDITLDPNFMSWFWQRNYVLFAVVKDQWTKQSDAAKSCPVSYRTINQYDGTTYRPSFSGVNPDTIGCVWTGEYDLNTLRVDGEYNLNTLRVDGKRKR